MKIAFTLLLSLYSFRSSHLFAQAGTLDKSFGNNGTELTKINSYGDITCMIVYPDGKILSAGSNYMVRNNADGNIDSSFGNNGKTNDGNRVVSAIILQPDNKIVVSANYFEARSEFAVIRYLSNGKADNSFGVQGISRVPVNANSSGIGLQSSGKIILSGTTIETNSKAVLVRLNTNGIIDSTFGVNGLVTLMPAPDFSSVDIAIQDDNKILMACNIKNSRGGASLYRFNANGSIDSGFGTNGSAAAKQLFIGSPRQCIAVQTDGKIAIGGSTNNDSTRFGVIRFLSNGQRDISFGNNGFVHTSFAKWFADVTAITAQADEKLIAVGTITNFQPGNLGFAAARYLSNGDLDNSFGDDGKILMMNAAFRLNIHGVGFQSNGKIIIGGYADSGNVNVPNRFAFVGRLNNDQNFNASSAVINIDKPAIKNAIQVFPNPAKDILHIRNIPNQSSVEVINNNGISVIRKNYVSDEIDITIAQLLPGIYNVRIVSAENVTLLKFSKQ